MAKTKLTALTDARVRSAKIGTYPDHGHPGLRLVVGKVQKSWQYRFRDMTDLVPEMKAGQETGRMIGRVKQISIGTYPTIDLVAARAKWQDLRLVKGQGIKNINQDGTGYTVKQLVFDYINGYAKQAKKSWAEDERQLNNDLVDVWGQRQAADVKRAEVIEHLTAIVAGRGGRKGGERAAQLFMAAARTAWNIAIDREHIDSNPWAKLKIVKGVVVGTAIKIKKDIKTPRVFLDPELKKFLTKLPKSGLRQDLQDVLRLQLLSAARKGEVCEMEWSDYDAHEGIWSLPAEKAKNGQAHRVMLSSQAIEIIERQPRAGDYVFHRPATSTACGHVIGSSVNAACNAAQKHFGMPHWTPHCLRHSALTGVSQLGASREIQSRLSNHADNSIAGHYDHNARDTEAREWLQKWADHLDSLLVHNVTPIGSKKRG